MQNPKILHGNAAKVDPNKKIVGLNQTNLIGVAEKIENEVPIVSEENAEYARQINNELKL
jgi:hypothetical protein